MKSHRMKVIVVAVDVGKRPAVLHYSFLTRWNKFTEMLQGGLIAQNSSE